MVTRIGKIGIHSPGSSRLTPLVSENTCLCIGEAAVGSPFLVPTIPGKDVGTAEGVLVADGVQGPVMGSEDGHLLAGDQGAGAALGQQVGKGAHGHPGHRLVTCRISGLIWSRSVVKLIDGSGVPGAFTKLTKRRSFTGSSRVARHSSA